MKRLSIILGALFLCTSLMATNKITGKIIDENNNQNIEYANVSLMAQFCQGSDIRTDGLFPVS